jgi:hypothetical protein
MEIEKKTPHGDREENHENHEKEYPSLARREPSSSAQPVALGIFRVFRVIRGS